MKYKISFCLPSGKEASIVVYANVIKSRSEKGATAFHRGLLAILDHMTGRYSYITFKTPAQKVSELSNIKESLFFKKSTDEIAKQLISDAHIPAHDDERHFPFKHVKIVL